MSRLAHYVMTFVTGAGWGWSQQPRWVQLWLHRLLFVHVCLPCYKQHSCNEHEHVQVFQSKCQLRWPVTHEGWIRKIMGGRAVLDTCAVNDCDNAFSHTAQAQTLSSYFLFPVGRDSGKTVGYAVDSCPPTWKYNRTEFAARAGSLTAFLLLGWSWRWNIWRV